MRCPLAEIPNVSRRRDKLLLTATRQGIILTLAIVALLAERYDVTLRYVCTDRPSIRRSVVSDVRAFY